MSTLSMKRVEVHCLKVYISPQNNLDQWFSQVSRDVLNITGEIECSVEPLQEGLNYLSDAFFVKLKADNEEVKLFAKERLFLQTK